MDDRYNSYLVKTITPHDHVTGLPDSLALHPRVFRLGFNSKQKQASKGFLVGTGSDSDIFCPTMAISQQIISVYITILKVVLF